MKGHKCPICGKAYECRLRECKLPDETNCTDCQIHFMLQVAMDKMKSGGSCGCGHKHDKVDKKTIAIIQKPRGISTQEPNAGLTTHTD